MERELIKKKKNQIKRKQDPSNNMPKLQATIWLIQMNKNILDFPLLTTRHEEYLKA